MITILQVAGAALGIPAAAAGSYSAYQSYFSSDATCQRLRTNILATMERRIAPEAKHTLLRKDIAEFDKTCGDGDPDARTVFQNAMLDLEHAGASRAGRPEVSSAVAGAAMPSQHRQPVGIFGTPGYTGPGWVALSRRQAKTWVINFNLRNLGRVIATGRHHIECAAPDAGVAGSAGGGERPCETAQRSSRGRVRAGAGRAPGPRAPLGTGCPVAVLVSNPGRMERSDILG
jgi:hypothetical protein